MKKDFDLAAAKRGAKVCTREGWPVRILCFDCRKKREGNVFCSIVAEVFFKDDWQFKEGNWAVTDYDESGRWHGIGTTSKYDLMMADDDYLEKLERGEYDHIDDNLEMVGKSDHIGEATEKVREPKKKIEFAKFGNYSEDIERQLNDLTAKARDEFYKSMSVYAGDKLGLPYYNWDYWRRMYAGMAMQGMMADSEYKKRISAVFPNWSVQVQTVAEMAVECAAALIEELKKTQK